MGCFRLGFLAGPSFGLGLLTSLLLGLGPSGGRFFSGLNSGPGLRSGCRLHARLFFGLGFCGSFRFLPGVFPCLGLGGGDFLLTSHGFGFGRGRFFLLACDLGVTFFCRFAPGLSDLLLFRFSFRFTRFSRSFLFGGRLAPGFLLGLPNLFPLAGFLFCKGTFRLQLGFALFQRILLLDLGHFRFGWPNADHGHDFRLFGCQRDNGPAAGGARSGLGGGPFLCGHFPDRHTIRCWSFP